MKIGVNRFLLIVFICLVAGCRAITDATLNGSETATVGGGDDIDVTVFVETRSQSFPRDTGDWKSTSYTLNGNTTCVNHGDHFGTGRYSDSFTITAPSDVGTYDLSMVAYEDDACSNTSTDSDRVSRSDAIIVTEPVTVPDPVAYWYMDEDSWNGSSGEVVDATGNGHDGFAANGLSTDEDTPAISGSPGTCSYADMSSSSGHYIQVPHHSDLNGSDALTYTAWIRPDSWNGMRQVMAKSVHGGGSGRAQMGIFSEGGNLRGRAETSAGRRNLNVSLPPTGTWTHVALVYDGSSLTFYINGAEAGTTTFANSVLRANADPLNIGKRVGTNQYLFNGDIDEVGVYTEVLNRAQIQLVMHQSRPCNATPSVDHYAISYNGGSSFGNAEGLTCQASEVTLIAHAADHSELAPGAGVSINLSSNSGKGRWSSPSAGTLTNFSNNNGTATYTFGANSRVTLQYSHPEVATGANAVNINTGSDSASEDPDIEFYDSGFRFIDGAGNNIGSVANPFVQIAGAESAVFYLQAVRTDDVSQSCVSAFPSGGDKLVDLAAECNNPGSCRGQQVSLVNNGNAYPIATQNDNGGGGVSSYTADRALRFSANSTAELTLDYPDVGAISLHARHNILFADGTASGEYLSGSSNNFVVKPANLLVRTVAGVTEPAQMDSAAGFRAAGESFTVEVDSVNFHGDITPNFGRENSTAETVELNFFSVEFPSGGVGGDSNLSPGNFSLTATDGRLRATDVSWDEAGAIKVFASIADGDYLSSGDVTGTASPTIGRFYPDRFTLSGDAIDNSCGSFSYLSEPTLSVAYTATAVNVSGSALKNYDSALGYPVASFDFVSESGNNGTDLGSRLQVPAIASTTWGNGVYTLADTTASFQRSGLEAPIVQVYVGVQMNDVVDDRAFENPDMNASTSGDCSVAGNCNARQLDTADIAGLTMRYGRLLSQSVHGPETASLAAPLRVEYWNGTLWLLSADDSCTVIPRSRVEFDGTAITNIAALSVPVGGGTSTATFTSLDAINIAVNGGDTGLVFGAPGAGNTGSFPLDVDLTNMEWLQFDWNQNGLTHDDDLLPQAMINFGSYRGHDRVIYWHERFTD